MASEFEETAEAAHDQIKEKSLKEGGEEKPQWIDWVAISTMAMAIFTALGALLAGITANEMMVNRTKEILEFAQMETDRIEIELLKSKHEILTSLGVTVDDSEIERIRKNKREFEEMKADVEAVESEARKRIYEHELFAIGATLLSIAITLCGVSVVVMQKKIWAIGLVVSVIGVGFIGMGIYSMIS